MLCIDHPEVQALIPRVADRRIVTYGFSAQADVRAVNLRLDRSGADFDVMIDEPRHRRVAHHRRPAPADARPAQRAERAGRHRRGARDGHAPTTTIRQGLAGFGGVKRRFTKTGEAHGITVIDDYGHHPVEIAAVLTAARQAYGGRAG